MDKTILYKKDNTFNLDDPPSYNVATQGTNDNNGYIVADNISEWLEQNQPDDTNDGIEFQASRNDITQKTHLTREQGVTKS